MKNSNTYNTNKSNIEKTGYTTNSAAFTANSVISSYNNLKNETPLKKTIQISENEERDEFDYFYGISVVDIEEYKHRNIDSFMKEPKRSNSNKFQRSIKAKKKLSNTVTHSIGNNS